MTEHLKNEKIQLLQKLQKLASSDPDSEEAKTAALMVAQIMEKYNLSTCDLNEDGTLDENGIAEFFENSYSNDMVKWESLLLSKVATAFDCKCIRLVQPLWTHIPITLSMLGSKTDVEIASWFFTSLHRRIGKMTEKHSKNKSRNQDYGIGVVHAVGKRLQEMRQAQVQARKEGGTAGEHTTALVLQKIDFVQKEYEQKYPHAKVDKRRNCNALDGLSFLEGKKAGEEMSLSTPIKKGEGPKEISS